jgi:hypothetical protein
MDTCSAQWISVPKTTFSGSVVKNKTTTDDNNVNHIIIRNMIDHSLLKELAGPVALNPELQPTLADESDPINFSDLKTLAPDMIFTYYDNQKKLRGFEFSTLETVMKDDPPKHIMTSEPLPKEAVDRATRLVKLMQEIVGESNMILEVNANNIALRLADTLAICHECETPVDPAWIIKLDHGSFSRFLNNFGGMVDQNLQTTKGISNLKLIKFCKHKKQDDFNMYQWDFITHLQEYFKFGKENNNIQMFIYIMIGALGQQSKKCRETYPDITS